MDPSLERLAGELGIEPGYHDVWGTWRPTSENAQRAILAAMGVDASDPEATLTERRRRYWKTVVPPVTVLRASTLGDGVRIHLPEASLAREPLYDPAGERMRRS